MRTLYFVRHGQSEANAAGITAGCRIDAPLTDQGKLEAQLAGEQLVGMAIDTIISSPMVRAHQTAKIIATGIGYSRPIHTDKLLVERDFGDVTGTLRETTIYEQEMANVPGFEKVDTLFNRMHCAYKWLQQQPGEHMLVVGHAGSGRMLWVVANGGTPADFETYERLKNANIYKMEL